MVFGDIRLTVSVPVGSSEPVGRPVPLTEVPVAPLLVGAEPSVLVAVPLAELDSVPDGVSIACVLAEEDEQS